MKILLCCTSIQDGHRTEDNHDSHYPLGLAYLQSYIEHHRPDKDEFINLYLNNITYEQCYREIKDNFKNFQPDIFGLSIMTHSRVTAYRMIEYVHENYPDTKIVVGGMHPSVMWKQMVEKYPYIVAVRGEGEITFNELVDMYAGTKDMELEEITGIAFHDGEKVVATTGRPLIANIDDLPFPKHELFVKDGKTIGNLLTSRGCPYKCNFCVLDHTSLRKVRFRSGHNIADEVEQLITQFPSITTLWIHDDAFMINKARTIEFCDAIIERGIKTQFIASARFRPISPEVVSKMERAGFIHVLFGLESGADSVISGMRKGITKEHVRYGSSLFAQSKMKATAFLIAGLPGETDETIQETIDYVQEIQNINYLYYDDIGVAMIYPGTEMYTMAKATGKIDDDYWLTDKDVPYYTIDNGGVHTYEKLSEMKETIRQSVSLHHITSPEGFLKQRKVIPSLLKYSQLHNMVAVNNILNTALSRFGLLNEMVQNVFLGQPQNKTLKKVVIAFEKVLIEIIMNHNKIDTPEKKKEFINQIVKQTEKDHITLAENKQRLSSVKYDGNKDKGDIDYKKTLVEKKKAFNVIGQ
jgi:radical SAM superfamily enzyme YgiQ (UPF0313 family)